MKASRSKVALWVFVLAVPFAPLADAKKPLTMRLRFEPEGTTGPKTVMASLSRPIAVLPMTDGRGLKDPRLIGENRQKEDRPVPVLSLSPVEEFATEALKTCLAGWAVKLSPQAELRLKGDLATLFVTEANNYKAEVRIRFRLENSAGALLWEGIAAGDDWTWGRDLNPENYNKALSDAMKKAYAGLLSEPGFQAAWTGRAAPVTLPVAAAAEVKAKVLEMMAAGVGTDLIVAYVGARRLERLLSAEEILEWKKAGIPESVIKATMPGQKPE